MRNNQPLNTFLLLSFLFFILLFSFSSRSFSVCFYASNSDTDRDWDCDCDGSSSASVPCVSRLSRLSFPSLCISSTLRSVEIIPGPLIPSSTHSRNLACCSGESTLRIPFICSCIDSMLSFIFFCTLSTMPRIDEMFSCCRSSPPRLPTIRFFCSSDSYASVPNKQRPHASPTPADSRCLRRTSSGSASRRRTRPPAPSTTDTSSSSTHQTPHFAPSPPTCVGSSSIFSCSRYSWHAALRSCPYSLHKR